MTPRAKADAKLLWKAVYAVNCLEHSAKAAQHLLESGIKQADPLFVPLMNSVYVLYARPFTDSDGVGLLNEKFVPKELLSVHKEALQLRHQFMAHRNAAPTVFPASVPAPHIRIERTSTGFQLKMSEVWLNEYKFKWMLRLCEGVLASLHAEVDRILKTYLPELPPAGEYMVNIADPDGPFFIPVK